MARKSTAMADSAATPGAATMARPTLAQIETAKRLVSENLAMASPMDEHIIQIALLLALNLDIVMSRAATD